jgi:hypothetical protein
VEVELRSVELAVVRWRAEERKGEARGRRSE